MSFLINDTGDKSIQCFPLRIGTYKGTASSKSASGFCILRSLADSNTITLTFTDATTLSITANTGDDYALRDVSTITSSGVILLS